MYVLDMVAHNNDKEPDVFQIAPGTGRRSLWLAEQAHLANEAWNAACDRLNQRAPAGAVCGRGKRSPDGSHVPATGRSSAAARRGASADESRSTLYNTDGQIFSDAGVPVVLFMENYDINRTGYHDTHDTWPTSTWIMERRWRPSPSNRWRGRRVRNRRCDRKLKDGY